MADACKHHTYSYCGAANTATLCVCMCIAWMNMGHMHVCYVCFALNCTAVLSQDSLASGSGDAVVAPDTVNALTKAGSVAVPIAFATASVVAFAGSAAQSLFSRGALLASGYHIQLIAMTGQFASPGVTDQYRECAAFYRCACR